MIKLCGLFVLFAVAAPAASLADSPIAPPLSNGKVQIAVENGDSGYRVPKTAAYNSIRQSMMNRHVLEDYAAFLSPIQLPKTLWLYVDECPGGDGASPFYSSSDRALVMCYQFMKVLEDRAQLIAQVEAKNPKVFPIQVTSQGFVAGVFAGVMLHETGHALFDILNVPIFGREEDAADEMSTFVALQFQKNVAELVAGSYADIGETFDNPPTTAPDKSSPNYPKDPTDQCFDDPFCAFADVHGTWGQRFYNTLCMMYGSDPNSYAFLSQQGWLPVGRDCVGEYKQVYNAFAKTVYPFIDVALMNEVKAKQWFSTSEIQ